MWAQPGIMIPDGAGYVVYLPSTWFDHDLLFFNEWQHLGLIRDGIPIFKSVAPTGYLGNHWTVGPSMLWYPAFVAADAAHETVPALSPYARNGISLPYNLAVIAGSAIAGLATLLIGYAAARRWYGIGVSTAAAIAVWLGTTLAWYSIRDSAMSHAASAFACAAIVLLSLRLRDEVTPEALFSIGLALGFAAIVRIQTAAFVIVPFIVAAEQRRIIIRRAHFLIAGGILGVLPELVVSTILYGHPVRFASIGVRAIGWYPWTRFWGWETLFSWYHGLFTWTPLAALAVIGLIFLWRADRLLTIAAAVSLLIQWMTNASADRAFWAANSFGARRFDSCTIFFLLGIAALLAKTPRIGGVLVALSSLWTMMLFLVGRTLDLNAYQTFGELAGAIRAHVAEGFGFMTFVRPGARAVALTLLVGLLALNVGIAAILRLMRTRARLAAAALYFAIATAFLAWCGANGSERLGWYRNIIARSRAFNAAAGDEIGEESLYLNEMRYLRKTGREQEAAKTQRELEEVYRRRAAALRKVPR